MSAVDAPPGLAFAGLAAGEFEARTRSRRLSTLCLVLVVLCGAVAFSIAARRPYSAGMELVLVLPLMCLGISGLGYAVRRARLRIGDEGVRWGWELVGFTMAPERMQRITAYRDAIAVVPQRGSTWFLSRRDWNEFDDVLPALRSTGLPLEEADGGVPWRARLQSYGRVLDGMLLVAAALSVYVVTMALAL